MKRLIVKLRPSHESEELKRGFTGRLNADQRIQLASAIDRHVESCMADVRRNIDVIYDVAPVKNMEAIIVTVPDSFSKPHDIARLATAIKAACKDVTLVAEDFEVSSVSS